MFPAAPEYLDPIQVKEVEVGREQGQRHHRIVHVDADLFLDPRLVANDLSGGHPAHGDLALPRPEILDTHTGEATGQIFYVAGASPRDLLTRFRRNGEGHVLNPCAALGGRHDNFFDFAGAQLYGLSPCRRSHARCRHARC